jgi:catechol 2,3-dioxygenase-like lactoylglutathione lyase family enzyme
METASGLTSCKLVAFVATRNPAAAKAFYQGALGLKLVSEDSFALVFDAHGTMLRVSVVQELEPAKHTVLGWEVPDLAATVDGLSQAGVRFERFPRLSQDQRGIWNSPGGARVAWFRDPDGNLLSVTESAAT